MVLNLCYLDHAATTPMRAEAVAAMEPYLKDRFGNPSGAHAMAREARRALDAAREMVAQALGAQPGEVVFTGGGSEADNLAIAGVVAARPGGAVCTAIEHHAVLHSCRAFEGAVVAVTSSGVVDLDRLAETLDPSVSLVSVMLANNEIGTVQPLADVADLVHQFAPEAVLHTDAVAAFTWLDVARLAAPADLVAVSAHKFGGPKGVGALVVRSGTKLAPLIHGGGQEWGRRSGTHNVAGIVAMAAAVEAAVAERGATVVRVSAERDRLVDGLLSGVTGSQENGDRAIKIAGNAHLSFEGIESEALLVLLDEAGICASAGSACASGAVEPSHVMAALGVSRDRARGALRLTLGSTTTTADIDHALQAIPAAVARLRAFSPGRAPAAVPIGLNPSSATV